jgi:hypothetical protein
LAKLPLVLAPIPVPVVDVLADDLRRRRVQRKQKLRSDGGRHDRCRLARDAPKPIHLNCHPKPDEAEGNALSSAPSAAICRGLCGTRQLWKFGWIDKIRRAR